MVSFIDLIRLFLLSIIIVVSGCGGNDGDDDDEDNSTEDPVTDSRPFLMGSTPFSMRHNGRNIVMPDWQFENMEDRDLLSLHADDFWGVPWDYCDATGCSNLPQAWVDQWQQLANSANATGKPVYLALSPLEERIALAPNVLPDGTNQANWNSEIDANGCYLFDSDINAERYKASYITYLRYLIDLVDPDYLSPAVEMNIHFSKCPTQQSAWIAWYNDVHATIKAAYPQLVVFPTFQMDFMYGIAVPEAACSSGTTAECFETRLIEALEIPADRLAFSTYPAGWVYQADFNHSFPRDSLSIASQLTTRKIWIAETGWLALPLLSSYAHGVNGSCGSSIFPETLNIPDVGTIDVANDTAQNGYISWLLASAEENNLEAVVWWLNRDYLDESVTGDESCPCEPAGNSTCLLLDDFYTIGGDYIELLTRLFGNMALRHYDGTPRPAHATWKTYLNKPYQP
ncbi:MAG: hypothetical protein ABW157_14445 [Candidatus Thiodiazotropha sp. LLP2]